MIKKVLISLAAVAFFIVALGTFLQRTSFFLPGNTAEPTQTKPIVTIGEKQIQVELAKTDAERQKGLAGATSLGNGNGMLFIFESSENAQVFWMKGMLIPLDIIWIKGNKIINIDKNVAAPSTGTPDNELERYTAGVPVDYVLEVNAGFSDSNSIKTGDSVSVSGI
jgi:uncharacterized membrane protein (UPF0127 family)